jgi:hypothetical protein
MGKTACGRFSDIGFVAGRKRRGFCGRRSNCITTSPTPCQHLSATHFTGYTQVIHKQFTAEMR